MERPKLINFAGNFTTTNFKVGSDRFSNLGSLDCLRTNLWAANNPETVERLRGLKGLTRDKKGNGVIDSIDDCIDGIGEPLYVVRYLVYTDIEECSIARRNFFNRDQDAKGQAPPCRGQRIDSKLPL